MRSFVWWYLWWWMRSPEAATSRKRMECFCLKLTIINIVVFVTDRQWGLIVWDDDVGLRNTPVLPVEFELFWSCRFVRGATNALIIIPVFRCWVFYPYSILKLCSQLTRQTTLLCFSSILCPIWSSSLLEQQSSWSSPKGVSRDNIVRKHQNVRTEHVNSLGWQSNRISPSKTSENLSQYSPFLSM